MQVVNYNEVEVGRPFFILHKDSKLKDITVWRKDKAYENEPDNPNTLLRIYFHVDGFWCNPPTDSNIQSNAIKKIERYGVAYLPDADSYIDGYKAAPWDKKDEYRLNYASEFFKAGILQKDKK